MYDPSAIVDLRRNKSFCRAANNAFGQENGNWHSVKTNSDSPVQQTPLRPRNTRNMRMNESPSLDPSILNRDPASRYLDGPTCFSSDSRIDELERRLHETISRLESFEREVLAVMKAIARDIHAIKRENEQPVAHAGHFLSVEGFSQPEHQFSCDRYGGDGEGAREALAGACVALEALISEARSRINLSQSPS